MHLGHNHCHQVNLDFPRPLRDYAIFVQSVISILALYFLAPVGFIWLVWEVCFGSCVLTRFSLMSKVRVDSFGMFTHLL